MSLKNTVSYIDSCCRWIYAKRCLVAVGVILFAGGLLMTTGCIIVNKESRQNFTTLSAERNFWLNWTMKKYGIPSEPEFYYLLAGLPKELDEELAAIAMRSDSFVLIIRSSIDNGIFKVIALAKMNDHWEQTEWNQTAMINGKPTIEKSIVKSPKINEDAVRTLSESPVTYVPDRLHACGPGCVHLFIKQSNKSSRLAIDNPYQLSKITEPLPPVETALKTLLENSKVLRSPVPVHRLTDEQKTSKPAEK